MSRWSRSQKNTFFHSFQTDYIGPSIGSKLSQNLFRIHKHIIWTSRSFICIHLQLNDQQSTKHTSAFKNLYALFSFHIYIYSFHVVITTKYTRIMCSVDLLYINNCNHFVLENLLLFIAMSFGIGRDNFITPSLQISLLSNKCYSERSSFAYFSSCWVAFSPRCDAITLTFSDGPNGPMWMSCLPTTFLDEIQSDLSWCRTEGAPKLHNTLTS